jgi:hypothetical protein
MHQVSPESEETLITASRLKIVHHSPGAAQGQTLCRDLRERSRLRLQAGCEQRMGTADWSWPEICYKSLDRLLKPLLTRVDKHETISFGFGRLVRRRFFLSLLLTNARGKTKGWLT